MSSTLDIVAIAIRTNVIGHGWWGFGSMLSEKCSIGKCDFVGGACVWRKCQLLYRQTNERTNERTSQCVIHEMVFIDETAFGVNANKITSWRRAHKRLCDVFLLFFGCLVFLMEIRFWLNFHVDFLHNAYCPSTERKLLT